MGPERKLYQKVKKSFKDFSLNRLENQQITDSRPPFPVKQGTLGYGGVELGGYSFNSTGTDQSEPVSLTSFLYNSSPQNIYISACNLESTEDTAYHNGSGTYPVIGDYVYTDSAGTSPVASGYYKQANGRWFRVPSLNSGLITQTGEC